MIFHDISKECYKWLSIQPNVKEESITDWLLYQTFIRSKRVYYHTFSRNEEANTGADWEWWILTEDRYNISAYRVLIQAKKLKKECDNYSSITYGNRNGMQIDLLLADAVKRQALPLYAYYIDSRPDIKVQLDNFRFLDKDIIKWCENCTNGVYLSPALSVRRRVIERPRRKITEKELINNSLGLSLFDWLFRDIPEEKNNLFSFLSFLNEHFSELCRENILIDNNDNFKYRNENHGFKYSREQFPNYLYSLMQSQGETMDWFESEYHRQLKGLSGVAVIDARRK